MLQTCSNCGTKYKIPDDLAGKRIRCKKCQQIIEIQEPPPTDIPTLVAATDEDSNKAPVLEVAPASKGQDPPPLVKPIQPASVPPLPAKQSAYEGFDFGAVPNELFYPETPKIDDLLQHPNTETIRLSRGKTIMTLLCAALVTVILIPLGILVFLFLKILGLGIIGLGLLCLIATLFLVWQMFDRSPKLLFSTEWLMDYTEYSRKWIPWLRVKDVILTDELMEGKPVGKIIDLILLDSSRNEIDRTVRADGLTKDPEEIVGKMQDYISAARNRFLNGEYDLPQKTALTED